MFNLTKRRVVHLRQKLPSSVLTGDGVSAFLALNGQQLRRWRLPANR